MRTSLFLKAQQFLKNRDFVFHKPKEFRKSFARFCAVGFPLYGAFFVFVYYFGSPTPDILFDVRRLTSFDFDKYIETNGIEGFDPVHRHQVESYTYTNKRFRHFIENKDADITTLGVQ